MKRTHRTVSLRRNHPRASRWEVSQEIGTKEGQRVRKPVVLRFSLDAREPSSPKNR